MAPTPMQSLLVVGAFEPELTAFRTMLGNDGMPGITVAAIGVGLVEAAMGMVRCIAEHRPSHALLLGTCGAFSGGASGLAVGDVVTATRARLIDGNAIGLRAEI